MKASKAIVAVAGVFLAGWMAGTVRADFTLTGNQQFTVNNQASLSGYLYDFSRVDIVTGGSLYQMYAFDSSTVHMSGGSVGDYLYAYNSSTVDISGGNMKYLHMRDSSIGNMSDGGVEVLSAGDASVVVITGGAVGRINCTQSAIVNISGGSMGQDMDVIGTGHVTFDARNFVLGNGLTLDGARILGTGILSGEWFDGTPWALSIRTNQGPILLVPEPATLSLLALGVLAVLRRRSKRLW